MSSKKQLYINFESNVYHIHHEYENTDQPLKYLCDLEAQEEVSFKTVERKYLRSKGINSGENPLCRHCYNTLLEK